MGINCPECHIEIVEKKGRTFQGVRYCGQTCIQAIAKRQEDEIKANQKKLWPDASTKPEEDIILTRVG
jgi:Icc-related predicted phosphoesterase